MIVVTNTSPLVVLDRIGLLDLLPRLYGKIIRPQSVLEEIQEGRHVYGGSDSLFHSDWQITVEDPPEMALRKELGAGETAAIALAMRMNADLLILDDLAARNVAAELGLTVTGTMGVILAACRRGYVQNVKGVVADLNEAGFRLSDTLIQAIIKRG